MGKHSPKPWKSNGNDIIDADDMVVCSFGKYSEQFTGEEIEEMNANAQLIAAAPELLEAAEKAGEYIENGIEFGYIDPDRESKTPELLRKAINKAKGADE